MHPFRRLTAKVVELSTRLNTSMHTTLPEPVPMLPAPAPGVYYPEDAPEETYHRWNAASNSGLGKLAISPADLRYALDYPAEETKAMAIGSALHCLLFFPEQFPLKYMRGPEGNWSLKAPRDARTAMELAYPGADIMKPEAFDNVLAMHRAILAHPLARKILDAAHSVEVSAIWNHADISPGTSVVCKARADLIVPSIGSIFDVKKVGRALTRREFSDSIARYGYARQAAFYLDGFNAVFNHTRIFEHFGFIVAEEDAPHKVGVFELDPRAIAAGRRQYLRLLRNYAECVRTGEWPGLPTEIQYIDLPEWAYYRMEED